jgi:hypothetical protein
MCSKRLRFDISKRHELAIRTSDFHNGRVSFAGDCQGFRGNTENCPDLLDLLSTNVIKDGNHHAKDAATQGPTFTRRGKS